MAQYIDKAALVAELERRRDLHYKYYREKGVGSIAECKYDEDRDILSFIDTLEVKEVDLSKEINRMWNENSDVIPYESRELFEYIAKHFFELGLKANKGE